MNKYEADINLHIPEGMHRLNVTRSEGEWIHVVGLDGPTVSLHISDIRRNSGKVRVAIVLDPNQRVNDPRKDRR
tara:strand:+ start:73 stop:294 length:222 start_codon:yes stop_codon:yes gene_type:complete